jgi:WD40 repeat protein
MNKHLVTFLAACVILLAGGQGFGQEQKLRTTLERHSDQVREVAFSHSSKLLASASWDGTGRLWEVGAGRVRGAPGRVGAGGGRHF